MSETDPPSPTGLPLVGNAHQLTEPLEFSTRCREFDSSVVVASAGPETVYLVQDPEAIEEVLVSKSEAFLKRDIVRERLAAALGHGDFEYTREIGMATRAPWQDPPIRNALQDRSESVVTAIETAFREADGTVRNAHAVFQRVLFEVFTTVIFGTDEVDGDGFRDTIDAISKKHRPRQVALAELVPLWDRVPTRTNRRFGRALEELEDVFSTLVHDSDERPIELLREALSSTDPPADRLIIPEVAGIMLGALEPLAVGAAMACDCIARHEDVQHRLRTEVDGVDGTPTPDRLADLEYLEAVISETLRLYPPIYVLFREVTSPVEIAGYDLEVGARVWVPMWSVHRDPRRFDRPTSFEPDRWLDSTSRHPFAYFPFGGGNRQCAGGKFAMQTMRMLVATAVRTATLEPVGDSPSIRPELSLEPTDGVALAIQARDGD